MTDAARPNQAFADQVADDLRKTVRVLRPGEPGVGLPTRLRAANLGLMGLGASATTDPTSTGRGAG